eukprot:8143272-Pyramimonas_sp.AAC.1
MGSGTGDVAENAETQHVVMRNKSEHAHSQLAHHPNPAKILGYGGCPACKFTFPTDSQPQLASRSGPRPRLGVKTHALKPKGGFGIGDRTTENQH